MAIVVPFDSSDLSEAALGRATELAEALAERTRKESELTPHIDSVKQLYLSLEELESDMSQVHEQLDELKAKVESESDPE